MKLLVLSDLHFEFHADGGRSFIEGLERSGVDVLILAGDIALSYCLYDCLERFCERFPHVLMVTGNHEYYRANQEAVGYCMRRAVERLEGFVWLNKDAVEIEGQRFMGATLWFPDPGNDRHKDRMADFRVIQGFEPWVYEENRQALSFFERELRAGDVVVTHHLPSYRSVAPEWEGSPLNRFFVCDVESLILDRQPRLWIHGHTHTSQDYLLGETRVLCNPFGYLRVEENRGFDTRKIVEL